MLLTISDLVFEDMAHALKTVKEEQPDTASACISLRSACRAGRQLTNAAVTRLNVRHNQFQRYVGMVGSCTKLLATVGAPDVLIQQLNVISGYVESCKKPS